MEPEHGEKNPNAPRVFGLKWNWTAGSRIPTCLEFLGTDGANREGVHRTRLLINIRTVLYRGPEDSSGITRFLLVSAIDSLAR
jgi:hypothetical protein